MPYMTVQEFDLKTPRLAYVAKAQISHVANRIVSLLALAMVPVFAHFLSSTVPNALAILWVGKLDLAVVAASQAHRSIRI